MFFLLLRDIECHQVVSEQTEHYCYVVMEYQFPAYPSDVVKKYQLEAVARKALKSRIEDIPCRIIEQTVIVPRSIGIIVKMRNKIKYGNYRYRKNEFPALKRFCIELLRTFSD